MISLWVRPQESAGVTTVVLGVHSGISTMATMAVGILSGVSRSRGYIQGQAAVVWSCWWCVHATSQCLYSGRGWLQIRM